MGLRICEEKRAVPRRQGAQGMLGDRDVPKTKSFMLASKMLLNSVQARIKREPQDPLVPCLLAERGCLTLEDPHWHLLPTSSCWQRQLPSSLCFRNCISPAASVPHPVPSHPPGRAWVVNLSRRPLSAGEPLRTGALEAEALEMGSRFLPWLPMVFPELPTWPAPGVPGAFVCHLL